MRHSGGIQMKFQSTLSMRRATDRPHAVRPRHIISIHALHEESDVGGGVRAECGEFQSTLSMRRATDRQTVLFGACAYFNPRSP